MSAPPLAISFYNFTGIRMGRNKKKKHAETTPPVPSPPSKHDGPCIVAALVWLAVAAYAFFVVQSIFNAEMYRNMPGPIRAKMTWIEKAFSEFQLVRGTFWCSVVGVLGCAIAYARRSVRFANAMIIIGGVALILFIIGTIMGTPH